MPPIITDRNGTYGGALINQKYSPLEDIDIDVGNGAVFSDLLASRDGAVRLLGLDLSLRLATQDWNGIQARENAQGRLPPLVVVSSGRADWIRYGLEQAIARLGALGIGSFNDERDLRALNGADGMSAPIYAPVRVNDANRGIYIVVHSYEYDYYRTQLAGSGIIPVGWEFTRPYGVIGHLRRPELANRYLVGFGASRFAAIEFCKLLRSRSGNRWGASWLIDDNVVGLQNFPGLTAVEGALGNAVCAGFRGTTQLETRDAIRAWANAQLQQGAQPLAPPENRGLIQQMSLWNIAYLDQNHLNFGPVFLTSAEDTSLSGYIDRMHQRDPAHAPSCQFYQAISVRKELVTIPDDHPGSQKLDQARTSLTGWMATFVDQRPVGPPPVGPPPAVAQPVQVHPRNPNDGGVQALPTFVNDRVLPHCLLAEAVYKHVNTQMKAQCQAVEQIASAAIGKFRYHQGNVNPQLLNDGFLRRETLDRIFKANVPVRTETRP